MKLFQLTHLSSCTTAVNDGEDDSDTSFAGTTISPSSSYHLNTNFSLQTLPSVPSLQSLSLLHSSSLTLSLSHSSSLSLSSPITSLSLSNSLLYASSSHLIHVFDPTTLLPLPPFNSKDFSSGAVKSITFSDGKILTAHQDGKIKVWKSSNSTKRHKLTSTLPTLRDRILNFPLPKNHVQVRRHKKRLWVEHNDAVSSLAVTTNGVLIYSVSWDKTLKVWDPKKDFKCIESVTAHDDAVNAVVTHNDMVYTGSADGRIKVWKKEEKRGHSRVATLEKHKSAVNALALNMDGSILFSGACDRSILVWEREDGGKYMGVSGALRGHEGAILCLINVSDFLISGSADRTVRIWRRGFDGRFCCLSVLTGHLKAVKSLAATMEGDDWITVFSGGLDGEIKVWKIKINYNNNN